MTVNRLTLKSKPNYQHSNLKDLIPIGIIALFGILGFIYLINSFHFISNSGQLHASSINLSASLAPGSDMAFLYSDSKLKIEGEMLAKSSISFKLENYDQQANYLLDLGDGNIKLLNDGFLNHSYSKSGTYKLSLKVHYSNEIAILHEKVLEIKANEKLSLR